MKHIKLLIVSLCIVFISGCTTDYDRKDIIEYVEDTLGITNFTVASSSYTIEDNEGYTDNIWDITMNDTGVTFHVIDDFGWGLESVSNYLWDDYNSNVLEYLSDKLPNFNYLTYETYVDESDATRAYIEAYFENEEQLLACYNELLDLKECFITLGYPDLSIRYSIKFNHTYRFTNGEYEDTSGDSTGLTNYEPSYESMKNKYIMCALDYRYDCVFTLSKQELQEAITLSDDLVAIYKGTKEDKDEYEEEFITYYYDIVCSPYGYGISFSSLYEILLQEGFEVSGEPTHYTFVGLDDIEYEISYSFNTYQFDTHIGYYYLINGEITPMNAYFYNHFFSIQIKNMTGLTLVF